MLFPQTLKDITMIYNVISRLLMYFSKWRNFCREAWRKRYNYIQIDKNKDLDDMYSIKKRIRFRDCGCSRDNCFSNYRTVHIDIEHKQTFNF